MQISYKVDFIAVMENPEKTWNDFLAKEEQKAPPELSLFDSGGLLLKKSSPKSYFTGLRGGFLCSLKFYWTAIISFAISLAFSLVTGLPCAEYTLLAQQAYFHPRGKLAMSNGFSVYYRGRHLKEMSQNRLY